MSNVDDPELARVVVSFDSCMRGLQFLVSTTRNRDAHFVRRTIELCVLEGFCILRVTLRTYLHTCTHDFGALE